MSDSIAARLPDLSAAAFAQLRADAANLVPVEPDSAYLDPQSLSRKLSAEFARGEEAGREEAARNYEEKLLAEKQRLREEADAARMRFEEDLGERLASSIVKGLQDLEMRVTDAVAHLISPFLEEAATAHVVEAFADNLKDLLGSHDRTSLVVRGPDRLLRRLEACLGDEGAGIRLEPVDGIEIFVSINDTTIETQLGAWLRRLEDAREDKA
ncbi:hypothetical protein C8N35_105160 [Breoghania corrubedonensis]|uniref:Flagellar assembly protein FliH n=1 Tax=Breoghania corrubedonensis TaxID=665038 RepID=A0A2T5V8T4_9HYPH|nr:hypothetical protein [Breoghania corrubedonensis]PTW60157.1 hypothetical protein C8N35_105160 [Breoghania corrubedonensis]